MFYYIRQSGKDLMMVEAPTRSRAVSYMVKLRAETRNSVLLQPCVTQDRDVPPPGYRYQKEQVWVEGPDPGWCRLWLKETPRSDAAEAMAYKLAVRFQ